MDVFYDHSVMRAYFHVPIAALLLLGPSLGAAEGQNFSGSYTLTGSKGDFDFSKDTVWTLSVIQTGAAIEVTRVMDGRPNVNRFPLDGTESDYTSPTGVPGKCKGQLKGRSLILESVAITHPARNSSGVRHAHKRALGAFDKLKNAHDTQRRGFSGVVPGGASCRCAVD